MQISDENLIAFLLGDADEKLMLEVESALARDAELRERLSHLRLMLGHMDTLHGAYEPPNDLIESTFARIDTHEIENEVDANADEMPLELVSRATQVFGSEESEGRCIVNRASLRSGASKPTKLYDTITLTVCLTVICCLVLPAIVQARFVSRKAMCANNLRAVGGGLMDYAMQDPEGRFPFVGNDPRTGFAGVYAVRLKSSGMPSLQYSQLQCPSLIGSDYQMPSMAVETIPTLDQITSLAWSELALLREVLGGNYAYNLGVTEGYSVVAPKYEGRSHFAILSDSPLLSDGSEDIIAHDGRGCNFLFEDGSVVFIDAEQDVFSDAPDHPFQNMFGLHAAGVNREDVCLGPSPVAPIPGQGNLVPVAQPK